MKNFIDSIGKKLRKMVPMRLARFCLFVLVLLLVGTTGAATVSAQDNTVTMIVTRDPVSLDPQSTLDPGAPILLAYIYDTLVYQTPDGQVLPSLASSWNVSNDNRTITFELQPGIVFSDGSPLNADAVIFTFERLQEVGQRSLIYEDISNITEFEKLGDLSVAFHLAEPSASLLSSLTYPYAGILSPSAVEAAGELYGQNPVGTGSFMLDSWVSESELTLVPNPNYAGHRPWTDATTPPNIDLLRVRFNSDEAARVNALLAGEADLIYLASGGQLERVEGVEGYTVLDSPARALVYVGFNTDRAPFNNPEVRRAVSQAIDKSNVLLLAAEGAGQIVDTPLPPTIFGYDESLASEALPYDPAAAQQRLSSAGVTTPLNITILTSTFPTFEAIGVVLQAELAALGINAEISVLDFAAVRDVALAGDYDLLITRYDWNDPDVLWRYLGTDNLGDTNRYFYSNSELDDLFDAGRTTFDPDERLSIYAEAQRLILEDAAILPLYMPITQVVVSDRVQGVDLLHSHVVLEDAVIAQP